ncbi:MAG: TonB-dependent receptor [Candidatus Acidiferrales bacterium]
MRRHGHGPWTWRLQSGQARQRYLAVGILLAVSAAPALVAAQVAGGQAGVRVEGVVRDTSGATVAGAGVELRAKSYAATASTGAAGTFEFDHVPETSGTVRATAKGFKEVEQAWSAVSGAAAQVEIVLAPAAASQQILVTAARTPTPVGESPLSDIQLTRDDLQTAPPLTLDDTLREVPGFSLFRRTSSLTANPSTMGVSLRGLGASGASRTLVLEDGFPLNDPFGSWVYWDRVPAESVESVEVAQEGASSLYGSEALGGVVQFLTRPAEPAGVTLETSYGNQNTQDMSLSAGGGLGRWESTFGGEVFHSDGYYLVPAAYRGSVDTKATTQHGTADLMIGRKIGAQNLVFARGWYLDDSRNNGTVGQINNIRLGEGALGANVQSETMGSLTVRFYGDFQTYHQSYFSVQPNQNSQSPTDYQTVPAQGIGGSAVWSRGLGRRQTIVAGLDAHQEIGRSNEQKFSSGTATTDASAGGYQRTVGVFGEDLVQIAPRWTLAVSGRFDDWSNYNASSLCSIVGASSTCPDANGMQVPHATNVPFPLRSYNVFNPRASLIHEVNAHVSWSASIYRAFRAPTLNELYRPFRQASNQTNANPNLVAERLTGGEAGIAVNGLNQRLEVRGTFFYNQIVNPVSTVPCPVPNPSPSSLCPKPPPNTIEFAHENLGRTSAPGYEINATARITSRFQLSGGYEYVDAKVISAPGQPKLLGTWVLQVPHNVLTFQARYDNPSIITVSVDGRLVGKQYDTGGLPMGNFFVLDAMASRNIGLGTQVFVAVQNLLNEQYVTTAATSSGTILISPAQIGLPIAARIGIRFQFPED